MIKDVENEQNRISFTFLWGIIALALSFILGKNNLEFNLTLQVFLIAFLILILIFVTIEIIYFLGLEYQKRTYQEIKLILDLTLFEEIRK